MDRLQIAQMVPLAASTDQPHRSDSPAKIQDAAQQFEALLLGQILRSERESGNGWLSSGNSSSGDSITEFAEQHLAMALAQQGGLGLASLIAQGLKPR